MSQLSKWIARQDARHRLAFSICVAVVTALALHNRVRFWTLTTVTWDVFALCVLSLAWMTILTTPSHALRRRAQEQDLSRLLISGFLVAAAFSALFAVGFLLHTYKSDQRPHLLIHLLMTLFAVVAAWSVTHTVFGLRYAHTFYGDPDGPQTEHAGGLDFPGEKAPNYLDFAYFSFVPDAIR